MTDLTIARTILQQFGGRRFIAMTGARNFVGSADGLSFRIPKAKDGINYVQVVLDSNDEYRVAFRRVYGATVTSVVEYERQQWDDLRGIFTKTTGLETSLGSMGGAR